MIHFPSGEYTGLASAPRFAAVMTVEAPPVTGTV